MTESCCWTIGDREENRQGSHKECEGEEQDWTALEPIDPHPCNESKQQRRSRPGSRQQTHLEGIGPQEDHRCEWESQQRHLSTEQRVGLTCPQFEKIGVPPEPAE